MLHEDNCKPIREAFEFFGFGASYIRDFTVYDIAYQYSSDTIFTSGLLLMAWNLLAPKHHSFEWWMKTTNSLRSKYPKLCAEILQWQKKKTPRDCTNIKRSSGKITYKKLFEEDIETICEEIIKIEQIQRNLPRMSSSNLSDPPG